MMKKILSIVFVIAVITYACTSGKVSTQNLSQVYKKESSLLHPSFGVFHVNDYNSELHFGLLSSELLYTRQQGAENFTANVMISYRLKTSYEAKEILDSGSVKINDSYNNDSEKQIIGSVNFKASPGLTYLLLVTVRDINRNQYTSSYINIDKSGGGTRQNFLLLSSVSNTPLLRNYISSKESFRVKYKNGSIKLSVRYYNREFPLSAPPFAVNNPKPFDFKADSVFSIDIKENDTTSYHFPKKGFYHLQSDTSGTEGLTIFRFDDSHPLVKTAQGLISPLRYITSKNEFEGMNVSKNKKSSVDSFWISCAGNEERAKELIKKFYSRVQDANSYFTSYIEGWETDRGLIYLVYGPPNVLYKSDNSESWIYGEEHNLNSLTFNFVRVINPFTDNDFRLERSPVYKDSWYRAVDVWRQGRVYIDN